MQRIYLPHTPFSQTLSLSEKELYHQITRVMRARVGQHYIFFDGKTLQDCVYEISEIDAKKVVFLQKEVMVKNTETSPELHLFQALPNKLEKLEYIVQKSCEVGYQSITFFEAQRSQILVLSENKKDRLKKIAIEAVEQCGGNIIPEMYFLTQQALTLTLSQREREQAIIEKLQPHLLPLGDQGELSKAQEKDSLGRELGGGQSREEKNVQNALSLFCHTSSENAKKLFELSFRNLTRVNIYVGPEGGFSQNEIEMFRSREIQAVHFGNRIFRTETVAPLLGFYIAQKKQD